MELVRTAFRALGPVVVGVSLLTLPFFFAPEPAEASTSGDCAGYDTVECSSTEWCIGLKWFGLGLCHTSTTYWPPVTVIVGDSLDDYFSDGGLGGGGGGSF